jgi:hypothetical protein
VNIIIDPAQIDEYREKYTVLELDTIRILPVDQLVTAYCLVDAIPILNMPKAESMKNLHENTVSCYLNPSLMILTFLIITLKCEIGFTMELI